MRRKTLEALLKSKLKWKAIATGSGIDYGDGNCALCERFSCYNCRLSGALRSEECPIAKATGFESCEGSPYSQWIRHHESAHNNSDVEMGLVAKCATCRKIAKAMEKFIHDLIPKDEVKQ
jgi:hypothetical protein